MISLSSLLGDCDPDDVRMSDDDEVVVEPGEFFKVLQERNEATLSGSHIAGWAELNWDAGVNYLLDLVVV